VRVVSSLANMVGGVALLTAIVGAGAGISSYVLYEANLITPNTGANLILVSVLCALVTLPIGVVGWLWNRRRRQNPVLAQSGLFLGIGTLGAWLVVVAVALGK
jgi:hypothetical protein